MMRDHIGHSMSGPQDGIYRIYIYRSTYTVSAVLINTPATDDSVVMKDACFRLVLRLFACTVPFPESVYIR
jgi:hypothetical protein